MSCLETVKDSRTLNTTIANVAVMLQNDPTIKIQDWLRVAAASRHTFNKMQKKLLGSPFTLMVTWIIGITPSPGASTKHAVQRHTHKLTQCS